MAENSSRSGGANSSSSSNTVNLDDLTDHQRASLDQFTSVTAQDASAAIPILRRSQWNVEIAISKFFDGETADPVAEALAEQEAARAAAAAAAAAAPAPSRTSTTLPRSSVSSRRTTSSLSPAPRIVPQPNAVARRPPLLLSLLLFPFSLLFRFSNSVIGLFYVLFPFLPRFRAFGNAARTQTTKRSTNPRDTAAKFIRAFEEDYGTETGLRWFEGGYAQALDEAKDKLRFLLVVLQSDEHDDTATFNREVLTNSDVVKFINEHDIILWGGSVQDSEAYQVSTALNCTKFPFACLITHTPASSPGTHSQGMSVIARLSGTINATTFITKLTTAINTHTPALTAVRAQRATHAADRAIREQQNSAYEASLARDRERARERRAAEERAAQEAALAARRQAESEKRERAQKAWRRWRRARLVPEPEGREGARVSVRLRDGRRVVRRFGKDVGMEEVYGFVECLEGDGEEDEMAGAAVKPEGYEHVYAFRLVSPMPRKVFLPEQGTVGELLFPSGNLVVEAVDEDEDEED